jgi:uncharacterized SAM-dependent methyltransferase
MTGDPTFAAEVREYLQRSPRQLPSKYFYDPLGSALFEAICRLPWYRITRAESTLIALHAGAIVEPFDGPLSLAELGCGSGEKLAAFIDSAAHAVDAVHLIDVSAAALERCWCCSSDRTSETSIRRPTSICSAASAPVCARETHCCSERI